MNKVIFLGLLCGVHVLHAAQIDTSQEYLDQQVRNAVKFIANTVHELPLVEARTPQERQRYFQVRQQQLQVYLNALRSNLAEEQFDVDMVRQTLSNLANLSQELERRKAPVRRYRPGQRPRGSQTKPGTKCMRVPPNRPRPPECK